MQRRPLLSLLIFGGALLTLLVLASASPATAQGAAGQFWVASRVGGGNVGVQNPTNDEYFAVALMYNVEGGGFRNCLGFLLPPHGIDKQSENSATGDDSAWDDHVGWQMNFEMLAVPTETRAWDWSGTQGLGIYAWGKHSPYATRLPPRILSPPNTLVGRLNARACICEQVQCYEQANNIFGRLGVQCGSVPPLDCADRKWWGQSCPACD